MSRFLKRLIKSKAHYIKNDLDKIITEDMDWIYKECKKSGISYNEYLDYYINELKQYELFSEKREINGNIYNR